MMKNHTVAHTWQQNCHKAEIKLNIGFDVKMTMLLDHEIQVNVITRVVRRQPSLPERDDPIWKQSLEVIIVKKTVTD